MGYRGKVVEQERARQLRAEGWALADIAAELGVSKSSASLWSRGVDPGPRPKRRVPRDRPPNALQRAKAAQIERLAAEGRERIGRLSERDLLIAGTALYAGEGTKRDGDVRVANSDPRIHLLFVTWLRRFWPVDESRFRVRLYLHEGLDLDAAVSFWSDLVGVPPDQFIKPYRAVADPSIRRAKHIFGCPSVGLRSVEVHRSVMGLVSALLSSEALPSGVAQSAEHLTVNQSVVGSSPTPGAPDAGPP